MDVLRFVCELVIGVLRGAARPLLPLWGAGVEVVMREGGGGM